MVWIYIQFSKRIFGYILKWIWILDIFTVYNIHLSSWIQDMDLYPVFASGYGQDIISKKVDMTQCTVYDWGWGRFLRITFFKPIGQTCVGHCGTWFFNKSHGIYPGDHFAKMSLHAFQSLFSKVDFSKVAQQCHIDIL